MSGYFKTIGDLERATYGIGGDNLLKATGATTGIAGGHHTAAGLAGAGGDKSL